MDIREIGIKKLAGNSFIVVGTAIFLWYFISKIGIILKGMGVILTGIISVIPAMIIGLVLIAIGNTIKGNRKPEAKKAWITFKAAAKRIGKLIIPKSNPPSSP